MICTLQCTDQIIMSSGQKSLYTYYHPEDITSIACRRDSAFYLTFSRGEQPRIVLDKDIKVRT